MSKIKVIVAVVALVGAVGLAGGVQRQSEALESVVSVCERSGGPTMTKTGRECNNLIRTVQASGEYEVLSDGDGAAFWIEKK